MYWIILDTKVIVSALRSQRGAAFAILRPVGEVWLPLTSVALILEYEAVGKREAERLGIPRSTIDAIVRAFCFTGREINVHFPIRPFLPDPDNDCGHPPS